MTLVGPGCDAYLQPNLVSEAQENAWGARPDAFLIEFQVSHAVLNWPEDGLPRRLTHDLNMVGRHIRKRSFEVCRDQLLRDVDNAFRRLFSLLSAVGVPSIFHTPFAQVIHSRACSLANQTVNAGRSMIPIVVEIDTGSIFEEDEDGIVAEVASSSLNDEINLVVPAAKASIDTLEKVEIKDVNSRDKCTICLETLSVTSEVSRMPCSHLYHRDCIVQWLERSHTCPLCRFEMLSGLS